MDTKASTPRSPMESKPQTSCWAGQRLKRSWSTEQGVVLVHGKRLLCKSPHKKHCTNPTLSSGLGKPKADEVNLQQGQRLKERSSAWQAQMELLPAINKNRQQELCSPGQPHPRCRRVCRTPAQKVFLGGCQYCKTTAKGR